MKSLVFFGENAIESMVQWWLLQEIGCYAINFCQNDRFTEISLGWSGLCRIHRGSKDYKMLCNKVNDGIWIGRKEEDGFPAQGKLKQRYWDWSKLVLLIGPENTCPIQNRV